MKWKCKLQKYTHSLIWFMFKTCKQYCSLFMDIHIHSKSIKTWFGSACAILFLNICPWWIHCLLKGNGSQQIQDRCDSAVGLQWVTGNFSWISNASFLGGLGSVYTYLYVILSMNFITLKNVFNQNGKNRVNDTGGWT